MIIDSKEIVQKCFEDLQKNSNSDVKDSGY